MKLNIGCGTVWLAGFVNLDMEPWEALQERARDQGKPDTLPVASVFRQVNLLDGLPCADEEVTEIVAEEILEHLSQTELYGVLRELYRVMAPGATLRGTTPDIEAVFGLYLEQSEVAWDADAGTGIFGAPWMNLLDNMAHGWGHRIVFTAPMLAHVLRDAGFDATVEREPPCSLHFRATKPVTPCASA